MPVTVSVVIPVRNDARLLEVCLRELAAQTRLPDEVIVVDNNSSDDSAAVALAAGARVVPCPTPGIPAASATGFDLASGDIIARLDADCEPSRTWIADIVAAFERRPHLDAVTGGAYLVDGPVVLRPWVPWVILVMYCIMAVPVLGHWPIFGSNLGMRRSAWRAVRDDVHRSDALVHDDMDLAFHLGQHHRIGVEPSLRMGISSRSVDSVTAVGLRASRAVYTSLVHFPHDLPPRRILRRLRTREFGTTSRMTREKPVPRRGARWRTVSRRRSGFSP